MTSRDGVMTMFKVMGMQALVTIAIWGCSAAPQSRRAVEIPMPDPVPAPKTPADAPVNRMTLLVSPSSDDTDGNGFPDVVHVTSSLFSFPHPAPVAAEGTFVFELHAVGQDTYRREPLAVWRRGPQEATEVQTTALYGICYPFSLHVHEVFQSDRLPQVPMTLVGYYEPSDGSPVVRCSPELRSVRLGGSSGVVAVE